jgi:hypothetical protein
MTAHCRPEPSGGCPEVAEAEMTPAGPGGGLLGYCGHGPVVFAANRVPCPPASAIEATSSMSLTKVGVAD